MGNVWGDQRRAANDHLDRLVVFDPLPFPLCKVWVGDDWMRICCWRPGPPAVRRSWAVGAGCGDFGEWLVGRLVGRLGSWLVGWLDSWLVGCSVVERLSGWMDGRRKLGDWVGEWEVGWWSFLSVR